MTDLSFLGWSSERDAEVPAGCVPGRVARVDRGRLTVLTADGELRAHPAAALLSRRTAFARVVAGRTSAEQVVAADLDQVSGPGPLHRLAQAAGRGPPQALRPDARAAEHARVRALHRAYRSRPNRLG